MRNVKHVVAVALAAMTFKAVADARIVLEYATFAPLPPISGHFGSDVTLSAQLQAVSYDKVKNQQIIAPLPGAKVDFWVYFIRPWHPPQPFWYLIGTATTSTNGVATVQYHTPPLPTSYKSGEVFHGNYRAEFDGGVFGGKLLYPTWSAFGDMYITR